MTTHTPGPWHVHATEVRDTHDVPVARVGLNKNARLIAAAPELLEALELLEMRLRHADEGGHMYASIDTKGVLARAVRAAIAKAKGETK